MVPVLSETPEAWHVDLHGRKVTSINVGLDVMLVLGGESDAEGSVELIAPFELRLPGDDPVVLDPADQATLGPLLRCHQKIVDSVVVSPRDSSLAVAFTDGTTIAVEAHERFQAWEVFVRAFPSRSRDGVKIIASYGDDEEPTVFDSRNQVEGQTVDASELELDE